MSVKHNIKPGTTGGFNVMTATGSVPANSNSKIKQILYKQLSRKIRIFAD